MIGRRAVAAASRRRSAATPSAPPESLLPHRDGSTLAFAQEMATHEDPRATKLYNHTKERLTQDEVDQI